MRTLRRTMFVLLALALLMAVAATALGAKPAQPGKPTTTTLPPEPTSGGSTCAALGFVQAWDPAHELTISATGFSFKLKGAGDGFCVDVHADGPWHVTGTASGVSSLSMIPRDSASPGDSCGGVGLKRPATFDLYLPTGVQSATVNSCGLAYGEWINGVLVTTRTGERHPLAFIVQMTGRTGAVATISVEFP